MAKKMKRSTTEDESSPGSSASSSEDISREEAARRKRRRSQARRNGISRKKRSYSQGKEIIKFLAEVKEEVCKQSKQVAESKEEMSEQLEKLREDMCKQSKQVTESKEEMSKQFEKLREEMCKQSKQVTESKEDMYKRLEKLREEMCKQSKQVTESKEEMYKRLDKLREEMCKQSKEATEYKEEIRKQLEKVYQDNHEMRKQLTETLTDLRKQRDLHTNGSSGDDSDASRSQLNPVQPPRYRLVFKSAVTEKIEKGQPIDISVALVDGNDQTVENGPLANATVELVVVNAEFNQHNNQHNWSREDFEINIKKARQGISAAVDVDQSVKSIVSDGRFNLVQGLKCHSGSKIFRNSGNKKVRLGVMVVSPTEERVLEGLSNAFYVRGHDRLRHNRLNMQRQTLVDEGYEEQNVAVPNTQNPSWACSTQYEEIRSNITGGLPQLSIIGNTTMLSPGLNITGGQPQVPFLGNTTMLSTEPSTCHEPEASILQYQVPHLPLAQATNSQTDELSAALVGNVRNPNIMGNDYAPFLEIGTPNYTIHRTLPVRLILDRLNVEPTKHCWNIHDHLSVKVPKPSNRKLLPNSTRQLSLSRLSLKGRSLTLETLSCTEKENCLLLTGHRYQLEELLGNLAMLSALNLDGTLVPGGIRSLEYMPLESIQLSHTPAPTLRALTCNSLLLRRMNLNLCQHLTNLTKLHLFGVMSCKELPQLCQLQVLQILCLEKLRSLCSHVVSMPFPELRELWLHDLESLEKWVATEGKEEQLIFPLLEKIVIKKCPKLICLPEAPKLKDIELDDGKLPLSLALVKFRPMSSVSKMCSDDTQATKRSHQIDQNLDSSLSELNLKGLAHEDS